MVGHYQMQKEDLLWNAMIAATLQTAIISPVQARSKRFCRKTFCACGEMSGMFY